MSAAVVRCTSCEQPSRVPTTALGLVVACPRCHHQFVAAEVQTTAPPPRPKVIRTGPAFPTDDIPVVHRRPKPSTRPEHPDEIPTVHPPQSGGGPIALALLPVGVPLLWLILSLTVGPSAFSFVAPVAIALGTVGLGLGLAFIRRWSVPLRMRLLVALTVLGYAAAALFYFAQESWLERVREVAAVTGLTWRDFHPEDKSFRLLVPGERTETASPVADWKLTAWQFVDPKNAVDVYVVAYGEAPPKLGKWTDKPSKEAWFNAARDALTTACEGKLLDERVVSVVDGEGREYEYELAGGKHRVVRLIRSDKRVVYLAVEGQYLTAERTDVQKYLRSFKFTPNPKPGQKPPNA
jgi:hypothetical protein